MLARLTMALLLIGLVGCKKQVANAPPASPEVGSPQEDQPASEVPAEKTADSPPATAADNAAKELTPEPAKADVEGSPAEEGSSTENALALEEPHELDEGSDAKPIEADGAEGESVQAEVADAEKLPRERFLLLTRDGPLVIDVLMTIDGEPYAQALESVLDRAFAEADDDENGEATWEELLDNPKFAYGQFGNLIPDGEDERAQLVRMYDNNNNSLVERDELPRFLTRNAGGSRAFSLQSSNEFHGENRSRSHIRRLLDQNRDGAITGEELAAAPARLFNRDSDDDEILVLTDFKETVQTMQAPMPNRRRINAPDTAILLGDRTRWSTVVYALQETYAYGNRVGADDVPLTPRLVERLDENGNEVIDSKEVPKLREISPHLEFEVTFFNKSAGGEDASPKIRLISVCDELRSIVDSALTHPTRLSMQVPGAEVEFFVNDDASLLNTSQVVSNQFNMLDADNNDYIDEDEYSGQFLGFDISFEAADADGNGMIVEGEVLAFVEIRQSVMRSQIRARAADQEDALFTFLDTNADGRLTAREVYGAPEALRTLDRNNDERVQSHEIPGTIAVGFVRGNPQNNNLFATPAMPVADREAPRWFRGMDTNGDGDISPREFLGSQEKFLDLDSDDDGFIGIDEIAELVTQSDDDEPDDSEAEDSSSASAE